MQIETCPACNGRVEAPPGASTLISCPGCLVKFLPSGTRHVTLLARLSSGATSCVGDIPLPSEFLSRFQIGWVLGTGVSGTVYLARELASDRPVALKFLTRFDEKHILTRFVREGRILTRVQHPNVVAVHEAGEIAGYPYLTLEYVDGGSLKDRLEKERCLVPAEAVRVMRDILSGLAACHERKVIHRDLKPANILLTRAGQAKLADLGIAKAFLGDETTLTGTGMILGTPRYMSPEQARGDAATDLSDLYAAGVILHEMLAGAPPFRSSNALELLKLHQEGKPPDLTAEAPAVSPALASVVAGALAKAPLDRPASAREFLDQLDRAMLPGALPRRSPARAAAVGPASPRPPAGATAGGAALALVLVLAVCAVWAVWPSRPATMGPRRDGSPATASPVPPTVGSAKPAAALPPVPAARRLRFPHDFDLSPVEARSLAPLWQTELEGEPSVDQTVLLMDAPEPFPVVTQRPPEDGGDRVTALDFARGRALWTVRVPRSTSAGRLAVVGLPRRVAIVDGHEGIRVLDRLTGRSMKTIQLDARLDRVDVLGIDHQDVAVGGPGLVAEIRPEHPWSGTVDPKGAEVLVVQGRTPARARVLGAGRGLAIVQEAQDRVHAIAIPSGSTAWTGPVRGRVLTALVRMRFVLVGGDLLHVFDSRAGTLLDTIELDGPIRRLDERANMLYVMHGPDRLSVLNLDTREPYYTVRGPVAFQYHWQQELVLDRRGRIHLLPAPGTGRPSRSLLAHPEMPASDQRRIRTAAGRVLISSGADRPGAFRISCFQLPGTR